MKIYIVFIVFVNLLFADMPASYYSCYFCHGEKGELYYDNLEPINKMDKATLKSILLLYQDGKRDLVGLGDMMQQQTKNLTKQDIDDIADYIGKD